MSSTTTASSNLTNGHSGTQDPMLPPAPAPVPTKKGKGKKEKIGADETSKLLAAKISQLEQDAAGEKDQEAEIGALNLLFAGSTGFLPACGLVFDGLTLRRLL